MSLFALPNAQHQPEMLARLDEIKDDLLAPPRLGDGLNGTMALTEKWPVFGRYEQAARWLQVWSDLGVRRARSTRTPVG